jgi:hypothetical protein
VIANYHLGAVSRQECGEYLEHRLRCVGWEGDPAFEEAAIDAIYARSAGIPRKINNLCSRLMLYGFLEELHFFGPAEVERVAGDLEKENAFKGDIPAGPGLRNGPPGPEAKPSEDLSAKVAALDRRLRIQEGFVRRLVVALQETFTGQSNVDH